MGRGARACQPVFLLPTNDPSGPANLLHAGLIDLPSCHNARVSFALHRRPMHLRTGSAEENPPLEIVINRDFDHGVTERLGPHGIRHSFMQFIPIRDGNETEGIVSAVFAADFSNRGVASRCQRFG